MDFNVEHDTEALHWLLWLPWNSNIKICSMKSKCLQERLKIRWEVLGKMQETSCTPHIAVGGNNC